MLLESAITLGAVEWFGFACLRFKLFVLVLSFLVKEEKLKGWYVCILRDLFPLVIVVAVSSVNENVFQRSSPLIECVCVEMLYIFLCRVFKAASVGHLTHPVCT